MRHFLFLALIICSFCLFAQPEKLKTGRDTLITIKKAAEQGFHHDYLLFIPEGTPLKKKTFLLVEPNNTGKISDSTEIHYQHAVQLASLSSVGNNISTQLRIPLLVPVFPRPAAQPLMYTHALDRDVMLETTPSLRRLDLQLLAMIADADTLLRSMDILVDPQFFLNGFSASGTFSNRFSMMHSGRIRAMALGGFNGELMLPQDMLNGVLLDYPIGTNDLEKLTGDTLHLETYRKIPQFIYMGKLDDNDAVQFDDAYNNSDRKIINRNIGSNVQDRYKKCQELYRGKNINASFRSYENVGHWTTSQVNLDVIMFFLEKMKEDGSLKGN